MSKIVVIDYGMGNLRSVEKAFERLSIKVEISSITNTIENADKLILPGVGNFEMGMQNLNKLNLTETIKNQVVVERKPILGICLGMQLLTNSSEEGKVEGLGLINAQTVKFEIESNNYKVPHMGWNTITRTKNNKFLSGLAPDDIFYFVHSYFVICNNDKDIIATTVYSKSFVSGFKRENVLGFQFHPEKSHKPGLQLLKNFAERF